MKENEKKMCLALTDQDDSNWLMDSTCSLPWARWCLWFMLLGNKSKGEIREKFVTWEKNASEASLGLKS